MKKQALSLAAILGLSVMVSAPASAGSFESAVKDATTEIDRAKSMNYEWRDSRKLLKEAQSLYEKGDKDKAMQMVEQAKAQGKLAVAQAKAQSSVSGPH